MNLTFDNLSELDDFLDWSLRYGAAWAATQRSPASASLPATAGGTGGTYAVPPGVSLIASATGSGGGDVAFDTPPTGCKGENCGTTDGDHSPECVAEHERACNSGTATTPASEPARRKRRTKAEIEADAKAAAVAHVDTDRVVHADGSVTTTSVGLPPDVDPREVTTPAGANPFEQVDNTLSTPETTAAGDATAEPEVVTPFQHLTRAREFIAKHGMPKYNESFSKAGLDANVMAYTGYQRALHLAALDELEKA